jgi:hypothetical protein
MNSSEYNNETNKIWYNHYRGYIVKNYLDPNTNMIIQKKIPYNQPNNIINFINNYFKNINTDKNTNKNTNF